MKSAKPLFFSIGVVCGTFCIAWFFILPMQLPNNASKSARHASHQLDFVSETGKQTAKSSQQGVRTQASSADRRSSATSSGSASDQFRNLVATDFAISGDSVGNKSGPHPNLEIPDICTSELPGLNFDDHRKSLVEIRDAIRRNELSRGVVSKQFDAVNPAVAKNQANDASNIALVQRGSFESLPAEEVTFQTGAEIPVNSPLPRIGLEEINPHSNISAIQNVAYLEAAANPNVDPHFEAFSRDAFPSATECKTCHEQIYREWSMSSHAYASISPMFHKFEQRINDLAQGTVGYFCLRCHAPIATTMELRRDQAIWDGPRVFREGVTCVACHRVVQAHGRDNGERRAEPGDLSSPVVGGGDGTGVNIAIKNASVLKVKTDPNDKSPGQVIHRRAIKFDQLSKSTFCVSCHQVAVEPGISLEVVWNQYRASPAWRKGTTCQDCHMGRVPGRDEGYSVGPVAIVNGKAVTADRKHSNHQFYGPGYSIAHPGIFPQNPDADKWTINEWLQFDWRAGWGTEKFEEDLEKGLTSGFFPPIWSDADDRMDAREIVDANLKLLGYKRDLRRQVMVNGAKLEGPFFKKPPQAGKPFKFHYKVTNINTGHNMPSGSLGAQPQLWLNVVLIGPSGNRLWESGYLDSVGDLADLHSADVLARRIPLDAQLFNLQTKFLTTNVKGTDREMYLPVNVDFDQLPFIRPDARPNTVMNHPPFIRMEGHSIAATGSRNAKYKIPAGLLSQPGCYRLSVRMRSRAEPIYFMKDVRATPEMIQAMNEGILDVHTYSKTFIVR